MSSYPWRCLLFVLTVGTAEALAVPDVITIPQMTSAPAIDGIVEPREWTDAALLPPLGRLPNGASGGHDAHLYLGWRGDSLFIAVRCRRSPYASALQSADDCLELKFASASGGTKRFLVRPGKPSQGFENKTRTTEAGWEAELQLPFTAAGGKQDCTLTASLHQPSLGLVSAPLTQGLMFFDQRLACRFTEAGEFSQGKYQGAEIEIINAGAADAIADVTLVLKGGTEEIRRTVEKQVKLRANSNNRFRVVAPWRAGEYSVAYEVKGGDVILAQGEFGFQAGGPIRVALVPFYLWRDGVFVRIEVLNGKAADVTLKVQNPTRRKTFFETTLRTGDNGEGEGFVSTKAVKPGPYLVSVEARQEGVKVAWTTAALYR